MLWQSLNKLPDTGRAVSSSGFFFFVITGVVLYFEYCGHYWPIVPAPDDRWLWSWINWWNEDWQGKPKYSEKTWPSATLSTTNLTWLDPGSRPGSMWDLWWTNRQWGRFSPSISVSPANHSTNFSIIIFTRGWHNRPLVAAVPSGPNWTLPPTIPARSDTSTKHFQIISYYKTSDFHLITVLTVYVRVRIFLAKRSVVGHR
jgi:hypothetical protein